MWVSYSYDIGSISHSTERFCLQVPDDIVAGKKLTYSKLLELLTENSAYLSETTLISYYCPIIGAYRLLGTNDSLPVSEDIEILIKGSIESEIGCIVDQIGDLEERIFGLNHRISNQEEIPIPPTTAKQQIDIAMLYAAPLVRKENIYIKNCDYWNLDFSKERNKLLEVLSRNEIKATIKFEFATLENLSAALECKPKIIHISCHGYYRNNSKNEFVLAFESSKNIGMRDEVTPIRLKNMLQAFKNYDGIVIVSACFSQAIGHVFLEAGIKYVITIHDQCKIHDEAAIEFSVIFYRNLFKGKLIIQSFREAIKGVSAMQSNISACCCLHNHAKSCQLKNKRHEEHTPDEDCKCGDINLSLHSIDCVWAESFNSKYHPDRQPTEEEIKSGFWTICCCPPPLIPHREAKKFKLLRQKDDNSDVALFSGRENREVCYIEQGYETALKPQTIDEKILGRGKEMKETLEKLSGSERILILYGKQGIGKTLIVKHIANYGFERKLFKNGVIYIDMKGKKFSQSVNKKIAKKLNSPWEKNNEHLVKLIGGMHILLIIDNLDSSIKGLMTEISAKIQYFRERTQFPRFCIVTDTLIPITDAEFYKLGPLEQSSAGRFFKCKLDEKVYKSIRNDLKKIVETIDLSPLNLMKYATRFKEENLKTIMESLQPSKVQEAKRNSIQFISSNETEQLALSLNYVKSRNSDSISFLQIINNFPAGVYKTDLEIICNQKCYNFNEFLTLFSKEHSWMIQSTEDIIKLDESLKYHVELNYFTCAPISYYKYLSVLTQSIYLRLMELPQVQAYDILKSLTNLFFSPYPEDLRKNQVWGTIMERKISPLEMFREMKKNILPLFAMDTPKMKKERDSAEINEICADVFQICIFCVRIYLIQRKQKKAEILIKQCMVMMKHLSQHLLRTMLKLTKAAILYESSHSSESNPEKLSKTANRALRDIDHKGTDMPYYLGECFLITALIKIRKSEIYSMEDYESILNAEEKFVELKLDPELARLYIVKAKWLILTDRKDLKIEANLKFAIDTFNKIGYKGLEEIAISLLGEIFFRIEKWDIAEQYWSEGLDLSNSINDRKMEIEFKEKLGQAFEQIRKKSQNVIAIFRAYPIVFLDETNHILENVLCHHFSEFKDDLVKTLVEDNRVIYLSFEIGKWKNLVSQIEHGCRILHISTAMPKIDALVLENDDFTADVLTFEYIKSQLQNIHQLRSIELIVLACPFSLELGKFLQSELDVPNVICFDYEEFSMLKYLTQLQIMFEKAIEEFCIQFYHHLIEGKTVHSSWSLSKQHSDDFITNEKALFDHLCAKNSDIHNLYQGKGPVLLGEGEKALFTDTRRPFGSEVFLDFGMPLNLSSKKPPTNIERKVNSFVGMYKSVFEILRLLKNDGIVHVVGQKGIGKTKLVQHIGLFLNGRKHYKQGIFYVELKGNYNLENFISLLKKEGLLLLSDEFNSLKDKDILLIIDDCDSILRDFAVPFISLIEKLHGECKIHLIIISCPVVLQYNCSQVELKPLNSLESAALLLAVLERPLLRKDVIPHTEVMNIAEDLTQSNLLKDCMGIPNKIFRLAEALNKKSFTDLELERAHENELYWKENFSFSLISSYSEAIPEIENIEKQDSEEGSFRTSLKKKSSKKAGGKKNKH